MARAVYSAEVRAAVMAALLAGQMPAEVARAYNVPAPTVRSWWSRSRGAVEPEVTPAEREEIGGLLYRYVIALIKAQIAQAECATDKDWLKKQSAESLGVLHGIGADKLLRILENHTGRRVDEDAAGDA